MNSIFGLFPTSILQANTDSKNQVRTTPKMEFVKIHFSNSIFQKSSADQQGECTINARLCDIKQVI